MMSYFQTTPYGQSKATRGTMNKRSDESSLTPCMIATPSSLSTMDSASACPSTISMKPCDQLHLQQQQQECVEGDASMTVEQSQQA
eukprot:CAMPEP_0198128332 /NCGR_PEP_ID=MMETSP1442-20131203/49069_1 /TAXON_ID= /ORGANISM="Craspedostauros australis, Strain CCMP3328" /LENGTH=85 /DNA_ID=CAMNT_0043788473 /DNA_START=106 /DNA_END=360 /DNA_ORIENTATION=-